MDEKGMMPHTCMCGATVDCTGKYISPIRSGSQDMAIIAALASATTRSIKAIKLLKENSQTDREHHKIWVLDQVLRALLDNKVEYDKFIKEYNENNEDWDIGIAP